MPFSGETSGKSCFAKTEEGWGNPREGGGQLKGFSPARLRRRSGRGDPGSEKKAIEPISPLPLPYGIFSPSATHPASPTFLHKNVLHLPPVFHHVHTTRRPPDLLGYTRQNILHFTARRRLAVDGQNFSEFHPLLSRRVDGRRRKENAHKTCFFGKHLRPKAR